MFRNTEATESSGEWVPARDILRSTDSHPNQNDSLSSGQVDKADTSSHATGNAYGSYSAEMTIPTIIPLAPPFPPPFVPSKPAQPASMIGRSPADPTFETHVGIDELPENKAQSAYSPSDSIDASQLPQLSPQMSVRYFSQSQPSQDQSIMFSPPVSQNTFTHAAIPESLFIPQHPSQYSQEWPHVRTADGDSPASFSPQIFPSQYVMPPQQSTNTPPMHYGIPNRPESPIAPQLYSSSPTRQIVPQSPPSQSYTHPDVPTPQAQPIHAGTPQVSTSPHFYSLPNAPTPSAQSIHVERPQPSISQAPDSNFVHVSSPQPFSNLNVPYLPHITQAVKPQIRMDSFVANDPFQVSHGDDKVYRLTFDDIPTPVSTPGPKFTLGTANSPYGPLPSDPTFGGILPPSLRAYPYNHGSTQPGIYPPLYVPGPQLPPRRPSWGPEPPNQHQMPYIPGQYDASEKDGISFASDDSDPLILPSPSSLSFVSEQSMPSSPESHVPSTEHSSVMSEPQSDDTVRPIHQLSSPYSPDDISDNSESTIPSSSSSPSSSSFGSEQPVPSSPESRVPPTEPPPIISEPQSDDTVKPIHQLPSPYHSDDISSNSCESQTGTDESSFRPYTPPYPQDSKYQYPQLPESNFSRLTRFFGWSHHTQPLDSPQPSLVYPPIKPNTNWHKHEFRKVAIKFVWVTLPVQMYLYFLLRLPALYFSRVARIFEEAGLALPYIKKMVLELASQGLTHEFEIQMAFESSSVPPAYKRLASTWEFFIDSVMREWKTFNIISVLLLSAILTILQIEGAGEDPLTRYTALFSLMCALISLLFGCLYIIRFGSMRKPHKAAEWALEATQTRTIWWNVWVLLAMPAIWLTWSILLYIVCIMSFVWRSRVAGATPPGISDTALLAVRIVITVVLGIGVVYTFLIMTTFRQYGAVMDKAWKRRIDKWIVEEKARFDKWIKERAARNHGGSFVHPTPGNPQHPPTPYVYPDGSKMYQMPTYNSSPYYQPSFGDAQSRYAWDMHGPAYSSGPYVPPPTELYSTTPTWSSDNVTRFNTTMDVAYIPTPKTTAPPPPKAPTAPLEETPSRIAPKKPHLVLKTDLTKPRFVVPLPPSLPPIPGTPIDRSSNNNMIGSSSEWKNKVGGDDDVPKNTNRVRFRSPLISDQRSVDLVNKDMDKVPGTPRESSDIESYSPDHLYLEYV